jgi:leucyl/phenylalanyl-tRNA--protein transferase
LNRYVAGYFPLYNWEGRFYWERLGVRAVLPVDTDALKRARKLANRGRAKFEIRYTTSLEEIIGHLQDERIKQHSWVREQVVHIYRALLQVGVLRTVEAWQRGRLVGGLVGIILPGMFIAETMFGLVPEASKVCLCRLVEDCAAAGIDLIDVQTPHDINEFGLPREGTPHPCIRLGEQKLRLTVFMQHFAYAWKKKFHGTVADWLMLASAMERGAAVADVTPLENVQRILKLAAKT